MIEIDMIENSNEIEKKNRSNFCNSAASLAPVECIQATD